MAPKDEKAAPEPDGFAKEAEKQRRLSEQRKDIANTIDAAAHMGLQSTLTPEEQAARLGEEPRKPIQPSEEQTLTDEQAAAKARATLISAEATIEEKALAEQYLYEQLGASTADRVVIRHHVVEQYRKGDVVDAAAFGDGLERLLALGAVSYEGSEPDGSPLTPIVQVEGGYFSTTGTPRPSDAEAPIGG